ncbi:MAG: hypothetical protein GF308_02005 [Candidatus Heimdallarchaeota archaeon]|nr:hypothetical protein [Candidatus Heimdallarchaeota archaeon]
MVTVQIILDTNIPVLAIEGNFHLHEELERLISQKHEIVFLSACLREMDIIETKGRKLSRAIQLARKILEQIKIIEYDPPDITNVDDIILSYAKKHRPNCVVVTNDKGLKRKLRKEMIPVIFVKTLDHFELIGSID